MDSDTLFKLKYPIGKPNIPINVISGNIDEWIQVLEQFPSKLQILVNRLDDNQLDTPYRENGWTIRQVVHHLADSHLNSYIRFKWALTEDRPVIKAYFEDKWANLSDSTTAPISISLNLLKALHAKWVYLLKGLSKNDVQKTFIHPKNGKHISLAENIGIYAWHCEHHYAHIKNLMERKKW